MTTPFLKKIIITGLCVSLCVVLPAALHVIPNAGSYLCPMHIPVLLCGLICGWFFGGLCGIIGPMLSSILTGMPPIAILPCMSIELIVYGVVSGLAIHIINTKKLFLDLYISLILALILGKITAGLVTALFFSPNGYSIVAWATSYLVITLPAIIIQLILVPSIVVALDKSHAIPAKYPRS